MKMNSILLAKKLSLILALLSIILLTNCSSDSASCYTPNIGAYAKEVTGGSDTASINQSVTFDVTFDVESSCGSFQDFYQETLANETVITVSVKYDGCRCNPEAVTITQSYTFKAKAAGVYKLNFKASASTYITKIITVS